MYMCVYTHIHTHNNGSIHSHKKGNNTFAATWIDQEIIILSEESENEKFHMILLMCGI